MGDMVAQQQSRLGSNRGDGVDHPSLEQNY